jgi:succinoglycan biosynthesis transport protein ExoP
MDDPFAVEPEKKLDWGELIHTWWFRGRQLLKKYWWILLLTVSLGITVQAFLELKKDPVYRSTAQLMVRGQIQIPEGQIYREEFNRFYETQITLIESARVRNGAYQRMSALYPDMPRQEVSISAGVRFETSFFLVQAASKNPMYTQRYLDALLDEYMKIRREMRSQTSEGVYLAITEQLIGLEEQIENQENAIVQFQKLNNVTFIQDRVNNIGSRLNMLTQQLANLRSEYRLISTLPLEQQLEGVGGDDAGARSLEGGNAIAAISGNPDYIEAKQTLNKLEAELREFSRYLKPRHPKIIQLELDIERMQNRLEAIREQSVGRLEESLNILEIRIKDKESEIEQLEVEALDYQARLADFQQLSSRLDLLKSSYQNLQERLNSIDINTGVEQETVGIYERASPARESGSNVIRSVIQGLVLGLLAGGGIIFFIAIVDNRVFSMEDLASQFEEPVLGVIPLEAVDKGKRLGLLSPEDDRHTFAEACRNLRSSLLFKDKDQAGSKVVLVTSAIPGEGKSTVAANLAIALGIAKYKTLLIDADLRRGFLAQTMGCERAPGLADLLLHRLQLEDVIQTTGHTGLDFIPTGEYPDRPGELLLDPYLVELLEKAREHYQYIILDSAPVLATDDTTTFMSKVDDILFTIRSGYSRLRQIRPAMERLKLRNREITGLVLNFVDSRGPNYYYYKYNDYYSSAPEKQKRKKSLSA